MTLTDTRRAAGAATRPSVFVDGASGTTGLEIGERLHRQNDVVVKSIAEDKRKDAGAKRALMAEVDLVILCLPDAAAKETVALIDTMGNAAPRVLDASTAFRVAPDWTYGFPELAPDQADSPARRIYFALQTAYIGSDDERANGLASARELIAAFKEATTSALACEILDRALAAAEADECYQALKLARRIIRHEDSVLARVAQPACAVTPASQREDAELCPT